MRPIRLEMTAFCSYRDKTVIEFEKLGTEGLYLITGDTGAGKTTIFDAIVYALYGKVMGDYRKEHMLRCKLADAGTPAVVKLVFLAKGRQITVTRMIKVKKDGSLDYPMELEGWPNCPGGKKQREALLKDEILCLDFEQFKQIVMIAQGEFRRVLTTNSNDRIPILRKLFQTELYEQIGKEFKAGAEKKRSETEEVCSRLRGLMQAFVFADEAAQQKAAQTDLSDESMILLMQETADAESGQLAAVKQQQEKYSQRMTELIQLIEKGRALEDTLRRLEEVQLRLQEAETARAGQKEKLDAARAHEPEIGELIGQKTKLEQSLPEYDALQVLAEEIKAIEEKLTLAVQAAEAAQAAQTDGARQLEQSRAERQSLEDAESILKDLESGLREVQNALHGLDEAHALLTALEESRKACLALRAELAGLQEEAQTAELSLAEQLRRQEELLAAQQALADSGEESAQLEKEQAAYNDRKKESDQLADALQGCAAQAKKTADAGAALQKVQQQRAEIETQRDRAQAQADALRKKPTPAEFQNQCGQITNQQERLSREQESLRELSGAYQAYEALSASIQTAQCAFRQTEEEYRQKRGAYDKAYDAFMQGQAGLLAADLTEGVPCPVCGSEHHPAPCRRPDDMPTEAELNALKEAAEQANEAYSAQSGEIGHLRETQEQQRTQLEETARTQLDCSLDTLPVMIQRAQAEQQQKAESLQQELQNTEALLRQAEAEQAALQEAEQQRKQTEDSLAQIRQQEQALAAEYSAAVGSETNQRRHAEALLPEGTAWEDAAAYCEAKQAALAEEQAVLEKRREDNQQRRAAYQENQTALTALAQTIEAARGELESFRAQIQEKQSAVSAAESEAALRKEQLLAALQKQQIACTAEQADAQLQARRSLLEQQRGTLEQQQTQQKARIGRRGELDLLMPQTEQRIEAARKEWHEQSVLAGQYQESVSGRQADLERRSKKLPFPEKQDALRRIAALNETVQQLKDSIAKAEEDYHNAEMAVSSLNGEKQQLSEAAKNAEPADTAALQKEQDALTAQMKETANQAESLAVQVQKNAEYLEEFRSLQPAYKKLSAETEKLEHMSHVVNGRNSGNITLESYVLMSYFNRVVDRANVRLRMMTDGQYLFRRRSEKNTGNSYGGLELDVIDLWNDTQRDVRSLSGGEMFLASLSLALGLSDEVQSSSGGVQLDAMFIDEGFGSLDMDKLQLVMKALLTLSSGDKLIGLISHVSELKERIPRQIVIRKDRSGNSTAKLHIGI